MKICLINNLFPPYQKGGAETLVANIFEELKKQNRQVFCISTYPRKNRLKQKEKKDAYYISSCYFNLSKIPPSLRIFWHIFDMFDFFTAWKIKKIIKKEKPNAVITHNLKGLGYLLPRAIRKAGIKHIHTLHDIQLIHPSGLLLIDEEQKTKTIPAKIYAYICRRLFGSPDIVISPSEWLMEQHKNKNFFQKSLKKVIPNPLPDENIFKTENKKNINKKIIYIGQMEEHKGVIFLLNVFKKLEKTDSNFNLDLVGDGNLFEKLKRKYGKEEKINFHGRKSPVETAEILKKSDILAMPSICYENSPTVIYEAGVAGKKIIASEIGGIPELKKYFNMETFTPKNEKDFLEKIKKLTNKRNLPFKNEILSKQEYARKIIKLSS